MVKYGIVVAGRQRRNFVAVQHDFPVLQPTQNFVQLRPGCVGESLIAVVTEKSQGKRPKQRYAPGPSKQAGQSRGAERPGQPKQEDRPRGQQRPLQVNRLPVRKQEHEQNGKHRKIQQPDPIPEGRILGSPAPDGSPRT